MVLVPANMPRFGFSPCKFFLLFLVPTKYFAETFLKIKIFCRAIFLQNGFSHHVPCVQIITKVGSGTKTKTRHICKDQKQKQKFQELKSK